jgi:F0F1-type ATP synthase epsilon subunit
MPKRKGTGRSRKSGQGKKVSLRPIETGIKRAERQISSAGKKTKDLAAKRTLELAIKKLDEVVEVIRESCRQTYTVYVPGGG